MNLLLDSPTLLWLMEGNPSLGAAGAALIADPADRIHLSMHDTHIWATDPVPRTVSYA